MAKRETTKVTPRPLVNEKQISVSPYMVERFGFSAAVFMQRIHFWCEFNRLNEKTESHFKDGHWWMHKSKAEWVDDLPGLCALSSVSRLTKRLKDEGIVLTRYEPQQGCQWYALDYQRLAEKIPDNLQPDWLREPDLPNPVPPKLPYEPTQDPSIAAQLMLVGWGRGAMVGSSVTLQGSARHATRLVASRYEVGSVTLQGSARHATVSTLYIDSSIIDTVEESVKEAVVAAVESPHPVNEKLYRENIGDLPPLLLSELMELETTFGADLVESGIREAVLHNVRKMPYVAAVVTRIAVDQDMDDQEAGASDYWDSESAPDAIKIAGEESVEAADPVAVALPEAAEPMTPRDAWNAFTSQIRNQVPPIIYQKMVSGLKFVSYCDGILSFEATKSAGDWLDMRRDLYAGWSIQIAVPA